MGEKEVIVWEAQPGRLELDDGRLVDVERGDELLVEVLADDSVCFIEHYAAHRTVH